MKSLITLIVAALFLAGLSGCAATSPNSGSKAKCPACGHEFQIPVGP